MAVLPAPAKQTDRDMAVLGGPVKGLGRFLRAASRLQPQIAPFKIAIPDKFNKL